MSKNQNYQVATYVPIGFIVKIRKANEEQFTLNHILIRAIR